MQMMQDAEHFVISNHVSLRKRTDSYCLEYCAREFQLASPRGDELYSELEKYIPEAISTHVSVRRRTAKRINMLDLYFSIEQPQQQNGYHFLIKSLKIKIFSFQSMVRIP